MNELELLICPLERAGQRPNLPAYQTEGAAARDIEAFLPEGELVIPAGGRALVPTGLTMAVPKGWAALLLARSGLAAKRGVTLANGVGLIDSDYRGEVKAALVNLSNEDFTVRSGDRIAQLMLVPAAFFAVKETGSLDETARGTGGFGSTRV
ncbi:MAG: dUTP diphosphatase [Clostridia bacterium]|nr:dUTP diphosphatase [Clostridia bacterium]